MIMIFNLLKPFAEKLKYWDKNKEKKVSYQKDSSKKKPGKQRLLTIMEEFILTLVRLRLGLLSRHEEGRGRFCYGRQGVQNQRSAYKKESCT